MLRYVLLCLPLLAGCASEDIPEAKSVRTSNLRTPQEAIEVAQSVADFINQENGVNSRSVRSVSKVSVIGSVTLSRTSQDTLIYAVDFEDGNGYALISASPVGESVIGFTEDGSFDAERAAENPSYNYYLNEAKKYVTSTMADMPNDIGPLEPISPSITKKDEIFPVVIVEWGQRYPEGIYCPNKIAGCTQTAMAQMMSFLEQPMTIDLTYPNHEVDNLSLQWSSIRAHKKSISSTDRTQIELHKIGCMGTLENHEILGHLCRELGHRNSATYGFLSTGATSGKAYSTFRSLLGESKVPMYYNSIENDGAIFRALTSQGKSNAVAYMQGYDISGDGHAWVCDGGYDIITTTRDLKIDGTWEINERHVYTYHFNWGWCGQDNGYFSAGVFKTNNSETAYNFNTMNQYFVVYK